MKKILIIDDEKTIITALEMALKLEDKIYEISSAGNGIKGLEIAKKIKPDLILLDIMMPELDGIEVCRALKSDEEYKPISIILMTSLGKPENIVEGLSAGANDYVLKPFNIQELSARIQSHLRMKELYDEAKNKEQEKSILLGLVKDATPNPICVFDIKGNITEFNKAYLEKISPGLSGNQPENENILENASDKNFLKFFNRILDGEEPAEEFAFTLDYKKEHRKIFIFNGAPLLDSNKNVIGGMFVASDITERKQIERKLIRNKERLNEAQRMAKLGNWEWDIEKNDLFWSDEIYRIFGANPNEFKATYESFLGFVHPGDLDLVKQSVNEALSERKPYSITHRIVLPNKTEKIVHEQAKVIFSESGKPVRMIGAVQDITERRRALEKMLPAQGYARNLIDSSIDMIISIDKNRKIIEFNKAAEETFGYSRDEVMGKNVDMLYANKEESVNNFELMEETGKISGEVLNRRKNGQLFISYVSASFIKDSHGSLIGSMGISRDITKQKQDEEAISRSEENYRNLVQTIPDIIYKVDCDGFFTFVNDSVRDLGYKPEEIVGSHFSKLIHPDDINSASYSKIMEQFVGKKTGEGKAPKIFDERRTGARITKDLEIRILRKNSKNENNSEIIGALTSFGDVTSSGLYSVKGKNKRKKLIGTVGILRDISESKRVKKIIESQHEQLILADKMKSLGTMSAGVAHEINNPNSLIMLNASIFERIWNDAAPILKDYSERNKGLYLGGLSCEEVHDVAGKLLRGISDGSRRIKNIVERMKDYVREEDRRFKSMFNVNEAVNKSIELTKATIKQSTQKFKVDLSDNLPDIRGNMQEIEQVIINLITNSCQSLNDIEGKISIETFFDKGTKSIIIKVIDEGKGIPEGDILKITDPFFTTKRENGGTGLGLSISHKIIKEHGGELVFVSKLGEGTTASAMLPVDSA